MRSICIGMALALAVGFVVPGASARGAEGCGTYPPAVREKAIFSGWSDCDLMALGERPLWRDPLPEGDAQAMRFVFTEGHGGFFRVVSIEQGGDGRAVLLIRGSDRARRGGGKPLRARRIILSAADMNRIDALAAAAGIWDHEVGSWDGEEIYLHCQLLEMERVSSAGYRYSSVNIGCNQPERLMPLVDEIARLAGLERGQSGKLYR